MIDFLQISDNQCELTVDISIFSEQIISKMAYWLSKDYCIFWTRKSENEQNLILEKKQGMFLEQEPESLKNKVNQLLIDFKNRDIISHETKNIRDILYIKAFANNNDYEDFSLRIK